MSEWIATSVVRSRWVLLMLAALVAAAGGVVSWRLQYDWQVASMFAQDDPLVESYELLKSRFGGNEVVLAVYRDSTLWSETGEGLERLARITEKLKAVEGVRAVLSLAELHRILERLRGPAALLRSSDAPPPLLDKNDALAQAFASVFEGYTHKSDGDYVAIACMLEPDVSGTPKTGPRHKATIAQLRDILVSLPESEPGAIAEPGLLAGEPVLVNDGFALVQRDGRRLGLFASVLVSVVLVVCFRSIRWTLIPLAVVHWSLASTQAVLWLLGFQLTLVSSTLTAIVTVIGVATTMHVLLKFQDFRRRQMGRREAIQATFATLVGPILWACLTDAAGFTALMAADVGPVRDFGLMMAIGSMMVFVAICLLVPGLALLGGFDTDPRTPKMDLVVRWLLRRLLAVCQPHRATILGTIFLLGLLSVVGSSQLQIETDFTKNFARETELIRAYRTIEENLGGAGVWDIMLPVPDTISKDYLEQIVELEDRLRHLRVDVGVGEQVRLTKVLSIADADKASESGMVLSALPAAARLGGMRAAMPEFTEALLMGNAEAGGVRWLRVMLRSREQAPAAAKSELIAAVQQTVDQFTSESRWQKLFAENPAESQVTGYHVMLSQLVSSVLADQWKCFLIATLTIYVLMALATRSLVLAAMALVPNALPITIVLGTMGWLGVRMNMGAAMIAAVSLGLSIDSSIHYLLHYRRQLLRGQKKAAALRSAQETVGLAVVLATVALVVGFGSLVTSEFIPTVVFGSLVSLTMIGSLLGNLLVLPLLIGD